MLRRIINLLDGDGCPYEIIEHGVVSTAREAAEARGTPLGEGAKSILLKYDGDFGIFVLSATRQVRSALVRHGLKVRRTRFAYAQELLAMTGLEPGSVPPFGEPVLPLPLFVDPSVFDNEMMVFTAGSRTTSIRMATSDHRRITLPRELAFAR